MASSIDEQLVGHWSTLSFSYGVMEASDLGFLNDGRGWSTCYNAYSLCVTRFQWNCPEPGLLELRAHCMVQGDLADQPGRPVFASTEPPEPWDAVTYHHYAIGQAAPMPGAEPLPAVTFEEPVDFGHVFERGSRTITLEDDPSHHFFPYA